jgi:hypothetical protein
MKKLLQRLADHFYGAPARFTGGLVLNLCGYHVARVLCFNLARQLRSPRVPEDELTREYAERLLEDGIVVIPNYFPQDVFEEIKRACETVELRTANERAPLIRKRTVSSDGNPGAHPVFKKYFAEDPVVNDIVSAVMRKSILVAPKVQLELTSFAAKDIGAATTDVQSDNIHFDVSYPTMRTFFYVNDVDEANGAFKYAKGSHQLSLARLWMEYKMSIAFFRWPKERQRAETPGVDEAFLTEQDHVLESITGKANTLIVANTMGFHRRGSFSDTRVRTVIPTSFDSLESLRYTRRKYLPNTSLFAS